MKNINKIFIGLFSMCLMFASCSDGIDPITPVDPGADMGAPEVTISAPLEGNTIKVLEEVSSVNIKFRVEDDIEVATIDVMVDGNVIETMNEFKDYRIVNEEMMYDNIMNGDHTVTITATDLEGNTTTKTVNFSKEPPYTPKFQNEYLYMPFDGDYVDLMSLKSADQIGSPGFTEDAYLGGKAYLGAADSHVELPFDGSVGEEFTAAFWYKFNPTPDRAGILVVGPEDTANPDAQNDRTSGFRLFRELVGGVPTIKLSVGTGEADKFNNGGSIEAFEGEWMHVAFTVTSTETKLYFNGQLINEAVLPSPIDWSGVDFMSIMSGAPRFTGWNHGSDQSAMDELRIFDAALSQEEIKAFIDASSETLYMPFNSGFSDLVANREVTVFGEPEITSESVEGSGAYSGKEGAYLTLPSEGLTTQEFSASMWYNLNADPDRAGILVMGPEDTEHPDAQNNRTSGFRFFREAGAEGFQRFKLNVGDGNADTWVDGNTAADVPNDAGWIHLAFTISQTTAIVYINGENVKEVEFAGIDWTGCDLVSIMSGAPRFTGFKHFSDLSYLDELRFYNKVLTPEEIQDMATR